MSDLNVCIVCGLSDSAKLDNTMSLLLDDGLKVVIKICDEHAPDLTMKRAKELYLQKSHALTKAMELLKQAGYDISPVGNNNLLIPTKIDVLQAQLMPIAAVIPIVVPDSNIAHPANGQRITDLKRLDELSSRIAPVAISGNSRDVGSGASAIVLRPQNISAEDRPIVESVERARSDGEAVLALVESVGGRSINVPIYRKDGTGTTVLSVLKQSKENFARNFKEMAHRSMAGNVSFRNDGYGHPCNFCKGECTIMNGGVLAACPKCAGSGLRPSY